MVRIRPAVVAAAMAMLALAACDGAAPPERTAPGPGAAGARAGERARMVEEQIEARGVRDERVLAAMRAVPRHLFVPERWRAQAYEDHPVPLAEGQTVSQPYIVARMTEVARVGAGDRVLEVGTGSGYQAAVLGELAAEVWSVEILASLAESATALLDQLGYDNVHVRAGDGYRGWPEHAPFDAIVVTAAPDHVPPPLKQQLAVGGRLVIPVGDRFQELRLIERTAGGYEERRLSPVRFVPMTGEAQER